MANITGAPQPDQPLTDAQQRAMALLEVARRVMPPLPPPRAGVRVLVFSDFPVPELVLRQSSSGVCIGAFDPALMLDYLGQRDNFSAALLQESLQADEVPLVILVPGATLVAGVQRAVSNTDLPADAAGVN